MIQNFSEILKDKKTKKAETNFLRNVSEMENLLKLDYNTIVYAMISSINKSIYYPDFMLHVITACV